MHKLLKAKNFLWLLIFLGITKFFLIVTLIATEAYKVEAKEENVFSGCPPEFSELLVLERAKLYEKAKKIELREKELKILEKRIQEQMASLKDLETIIDKKLNEIKTIQDQRVKLLVKALSEMKASKAAEMLLNMDKKMAVKLLSQLKSSQVASILSAMPPDKAASLSEALSGYPPKEY